MDIELDPLGVVQIAEEIEHRRLRRYERIVPSCAGAASGNLCRELRAWSDQQLGRLAGLRQRLGETAPRAAATDRGDSRASNARLLTALAFFVAKDSAPEVPTVVTCEWMLTDTATRSRQAVVFYEGLQGFTHSRGAREVMEEIVQRENDHLHQVLLQLEAYQEARRKGGPLLACVC